MTDMLSRSELVRTVNEVYHDVEADQYDHRHPEILEAEVGRWSTFAEMLLGQRTERRLAVLDIGCGTGFVATQLAPQLRPEDSFVCLDVSAKKLSFAEDKLRRSGFRCSFSFVKSDGDGLPFDDRSFDVVTINSVLHHIPDTAHFLSEVVRLLASGGHLLIAHEPNQPFQRKRALRLRAAGLRMLLRPKSAVVQGLKKLRLDGLIKRFLRLSSAEDTLCAAVNQRLLEQGAIGTALSTDEINSLVDIHSPTAGTADPARGFDMQDLLGGPLHGMELVQLQTYDHLGKISGHNPWVRRYDQSLRRKYPQDGSLFSAVLRKGCA